MVKCEQPGPHCAGPTGNVKLNISASPSNKQRLSVCMSGSLVGVVLSLAVFWNTDLRIRDNVLLDFCETTLFGFFAFSPPKSGTASLEAWANSINFSNHITGSFVEHGHHVAKLAFKVHNDVDERNWFFHEGKLDKEKNEVQFVLDRNLPTGLALVWMATFREPVSRQLSWILFFAKSRKHFPKWDSASKMRTWVQTECLELITKYDKYLSALQDFFEVKLTPVWQADGTLDLVQRHDHILVLKTTLDLMVQQPHQVRVWNDEIRRLQPASFFSEQEWPHANDPNEFRPDVIKLLPQLKEWYYQALNKTIVEQFYELDNEALQTFYSAEKIQELKDAALAQVAAAHHGHRR